MKKSLFFIFLSIIVYSCADNPQPQDSNSLDRGLNEDKVLDQAAIEDTVDLAEFSPVELSVEDDSLVKHYRRTIVCEYLGFPRDTALTDDELELMLTDLGDLTLEEGTITHGPNKRFTILVYQGEGCGAYCNPIWESFILFKAGESDVVKRMAFNTILDIVDMHDGNYLILESSYGRPASTYTVECGFASLITFEDTNVVTLPAFEGETSFGYCQEMDVDMNEAPYIYCDLKTLELGYYYGNNYGFSHGVDVDTLREGTFIYEDGQYHLEYENIQVYSREGK